VRKEDYARLDYFDVWLPELAPSAALCLMGSFRAVHAEAVVHLRAPLPARNASAGRAARDRCWRGDITDFSVGRYGEGERRCHRSALRQLLLEHGAKLA
jgi:uncharacterized protein YeaO (DUF488 family)